MMKGDADVPNILVVTLIYFDMFKTYENEPLIKWFREVCEAAAEELRESGLQL